ELIERLAVSAPHVKVETSGGYNPVHEPPQVTKADDRLRVIWAHWGRHHGIGFDDPNYCWLENLELWRKAAGGGLGESPRLRPAAPPAASLKRRSREERQGGGCARGDSGAQWWAA
ncbi:MAG: hypothetical protein GYA73_02070, partial [Planctomycetes bacterium]|nr:hypothetical protein [Planctomycetota bacterium]